MEINQNCLECSSVQIGDDGSILEKDRNRTVLSIPRDEIEKISIHYGSFSERPVIQAIISICLIIIGAIAFLPVLRFIFLEKDPSGASPANWKPFILGLPLAMLGCWFFFDIFRRRYYLLIDTSEKSRKIVFKSEVSSSELFNFIQEAKIIFGYNIESKLN